MKASIDLLLAHGIGAISKRLIELKEHLCDDLIGLGFTIVGPKTGANASSITTLTHADDPGKIEELHHHLHRQDVITSFRHDRGGIPYIRFSPHFYNNHAEIEKAIKVISSAK